VLASPSSPGPRSRRGRSGAGGRRTGTAHASRLWLRRSAGPMRSADHQDPPPLRDSRRSPDFTLSEPDHARPIHAGRSTAGRWPVHRARCATSGCCTPRAPGAAARPEPVASICTDTSKVAVAGMTRPITIPKRLLTAIHVPDPGPDQSRGVFDEVMAYPVIDQADVQAAHDISSELFLPNLKLHSQKQHHARRDKPEVHRVLHGRPQPRVLARAAVARVPTDRRGHILPAVLDVRAVRIRLGSMPTR